MDGSTNILSIASPSETNLTSTVLDPSLRILLLTSANTGTGTSTSAMALAAQLAQMSSGRVLLVDASQSPRNLSQQLGLQKERGFSDLLFNHLTPPLLQDCVVQISSLPFDVLPIGRLGRNAERFNPEQLRHLFRHLAAQYRFVVIDADAVYAASDTLVMSAQVDGVVLVVRGEDTRWEVAQAARQRLAQAGAKVVGSVFNRRKYYMPKWLYNNL
ncbi:CpsD/CapB family tyrosine-protein kinase [Pseudomonas mediterranea]|uniref:Chromosome partitioning ATPase, Mrp family, contains Fe-S cluster n=1 Tax=Pseudomonas mediterranea TaxID=183795 RepID=A0AAX2DBC2_9PSED|nr:CpsD/CapB family tyrosine-protein kinase [Pseudomonas mediterranea]KGU85912.1 cobalamin biosynthesis protein CobQ [Pseudomonas mediterranea CFBP 5447]MBL0843093.1 CpsD/CapB family tyrosine-protein kinase [Pseudomonas mediterranea]UZD99326.1 CpsD/CapB family tyrosine-protein kinase [Pseudomonas mediterranea]CAH0279286.1 Putative tyrosine-protein kinase YveL [Pseudomonas mediterranea]SDU49295.1 Chromosome partitioning ATPase, Mrp family, contains Fe-S cluster [Pseudomonas mediterranea]